MKESHYIGAYWGQRLESANECACKIVRFLDELGRLSEIWGNWFDKGTSKRAALSNPVLPEVAGMERLLSTGVHFIDSVRASDLGYHVGIWNGVNGEHASSLSISCGGWFERVTNCVVLKLSQSSLLTSEDTPSASLGRIVGALISTFDPDSLRFSSNLLADRLGLFDVDPKPICDPGWVTYVSPRLQQTLPGSPFLAVDPPLPDAQSCVIAGSPPFSVDDPIQVEQVRNILKALTC